MNHHYLFLIGDTIDGLNARRFDIPLKTRAPTVQSALLVPKEPLSIDGRLSPEGIRPPSFDRRQLRVSLASWSLLLLLVATPLVSFATYFADDIGKKRTALSAGQQLRMSEIKGRDKQHSDLVWCEDQVRKRQPQILNQPSTTPASSALAGAVPTAADNLPVPVALVVKGLSTPSAVVLAKASAPARKPVASSTPSGIVRVASRRPPAIVRRKV